MRSKRVTWHIYKDGVLDQLLGRLEKKQYRNADHPYLESRFVAPLLNIFPHGGEYLAEYHQDGEIVCALVMSEYSRLSAASYVDGVCQISLTYIDNGLSAKQLEKIIAELFKKLPKFYLTINFELQDPDLTDIEKFKEINNADVRVCANNTSIPAGVDFETYWQERPKKVRKEIARLLRVLERDGTNVTYRIKECVDDISQGFKHYCGLEGAGWKGEEGTALTESNEQGQFYKQVITEFANSGGSKIHELYFDDKMVASLLTVENDEMIIVMKTTYDEEVAKYSPGRLLDYFMLQNVLSETGAKKIENYTNASANDQKWFPRVREMYDVTFYRSALVKQAAKFKQKLSA